jgi:predicted acetyltransferase
MFSILTASEGSIYGRFGYGVATWRMNFHVEKKHGAFRSPPLDDGRLRYVERAEALAIFPDVYERACTQRAGMVSRPGPWWKEELHHQLPPDAATFFVVHEDRDGVADGYLAFLIDGGFDTGIHRKDLHVVDLITIRPEVRARLWQFAMSVDLIETVSARLMPLDEPLRFMLKDPRRLRVNAVNDHLWLKILDIEGALAARTYSVADRVVLQVQDGATATRVELEAGPEGAQCRPTSTEPDLTLRLSLLGSIYLGGTRAEQYVAAGEIVERTPGAAARVDAMFAVYPAPATSTWF